MNRPALLLAAALAAASAAPSAFAQGAVRPGDMSMSCEAMAEEINRLDEAKTRRAQRAESGRKLMGFAGAAFNAAAPSLMARAGTGQGAMAAQTIIGAVQSGALSQAPADGETAASPEDRRLERVNNLFAERGC